VDKPIYSRNLNWNSSKLLDEDRVTSNLVSELFNKPFELFENNRELLDNLAYFILCQETIYDFEIEDYYSSLFLNERKVSKYKLRSNIYLHFVTSLQFE
jgi:hypothetical protein